MMLRILNLSGDAYSLGQQHGAQIANLRPHILRAMEIRLKALRQKESAVSGYMDEIARTWEIHTPDTLAMLRGMADSLSLVWDDYFAYTIASYLADRVKDQIHPEGCTTWAASGEMTRDGAPLLVKNRDYRPDHQSLQCLARIKPVHGTPYVCLTSAGSPGVFSSGMNAAGLAVADTYVASNDIGPGIARYSLMMHLLEQCNRVSEAVETLETVPHFGDGTVILADAHGDMAVFELAHSVQAVRHPEEGFLVSTNHFSAPQTSKRWVDTNPPRLQGNSQARRRHVEAALRGGRNQVDVPWAQTLMAEHGDDRSAICRHPEMEAHAITISTVIFLPRQNTIYVAGGLPCQTPFELHHMVD
jgi:isopenicillin-N N-acyltransferase-like protein